MIIFPPTSHHQREEVEWISEVSSTRERNEITRTRTRMMNWRAGSIAMEETEKYTKIPIRSQFRALSHDVLRRFSNEKRSERASKLPKRTSAENSTRNLSSASS